MQNKNALTIGFAALAAGFAALAVNCWWRGAETPEPESAAVRGLMQVESVFGQQIAGRRVDAGKLHRYGIEVFVGYGNDITLPKSENTPITYSGDRLIGQAPSFRADRRYLCGIVKLREETGWHLTDCVVQITSGPTRGALVWLVGPPGGGHIADPYLAWYELPEDLVEGGGPVEFEVVRFH